MRFLVIAALVAAAGAVQAEPAQRENLGELTPPIATVGFASGSAGLRGDARDALGSAVSWMKAHPTSLLVIQGFADRVGDATQNLRLSQDRADAVHAALLALGADPLRIVEVSYGEDDRPGRRVEVRGTIVEFPDIVRGQNPNLSPRTPLPPPPRSVPPRGVPPRQRSGQQPPNT